MKLYILIILSLATMNVNALEYVEVVKKENCTNVQFTNDLKLHNIIIVNSSNTILKTLKAKIDYPADKILNYRWSKTLTTYLSLKNPTTLQTNNFIKNISIIKNYIKTKLVCAKFSGVNLPNEFYTTGYNLANLASNNEIKLLNEAYPNIKGQKPIIILADSVVNSNYMLQTHLDKILLAKSMVKGYPAIANLPTGYPAHSNLMLFTGASISQANFYLLAIALKNTITNDTPAIAMNYASQKAVVDTGYVFNKSFGNILGNDANTTEQIHNLVAKGIPVVEAVGNDTIKLSLDREYNNDLISVGYSVGGNLKSAYGLVGPDIVIKEDGVAPIFYYNNSIYSGKMADIKSSGAAMITSSAISTMLNNCPKATPKQIKNVLCSTAEDLKPSPLVAVNKINNYVKCGHANFKKALDLLMTTVCPNKPEPLATNFDSLAFAQTGNNFPTGFRPVVGVTGISLITAFKNVCKMYPNNKLTYSSSTTPPMYTTGWRCWPGINDNGWLMIGYYLNSKKEKVYVSQSGN